MFAKWSRSRPFKEDTSATGAGAVARLATTHPARGPLGDASRVPVVAAEEQDPLFEGGGQVLLPPSFWEKAGWGIALLAALVATRPAVASEVRGPGGYRSGIPVSATIRPPAPVGSESPIFPRTSFSSRISLHGDGRE